AQRTSDAFDLPKGVYEVMVTDANNCEATASVEVMEPPAVVIDEIAVSNISCYGLIDGAVEVLSVSNAQGAVDYAWGPHLDDAFGGRLEGLASAKYTVTVTDKMGCTAEQSATVIEPPLLTLDFVLREIACHGEESATVVAAPGGGTGAYTYQWAGGETTPLLQNQPAGTYEVMVQDANGCSASNSVEVTQPDAIVIETEVRDLICFGDANGKVEIMATGGTGPLMYGLDGESYDSYTTRNGLTGGDYEAFVEDANGCVVSQAFTVAEPVALNVSGGDDQEIELGDSVMLNAEYWNAVGATELYWVAPFEGALCCEESEDCGLRLDCANPIASPDFSATVKVVVVDSRGCRDEDVIRIKVDKQRAAFVPTGFSPNNDQRNDVLRTHGRDGSRVQLFQVYDRWGEMV
ncbi:MAG: hypothetical protein AAFP02_19735, partial [Bacteroidota bacterium]